MKKTKPYSETPKLIQCIECGKTMPKSNTDQHIKFCKKK